jgi:hypothetical protein
MTFSRGGDAIQGDLEAIIFNHFKMVEVQILNLA